MDMRYNHKSSSPSQPPLSALRVFLSGKIPKRDRGMKIKSLLCIEDRIFLIRGCRVLIDRDLAMLYGVETKHLNRQVRRNQERFPSEFMFRLTLKETAELVTNCHRFASVKHASNLPWAFTEHGVSMLATVLKSERAVKMSIHIVKTFVRLRHWVETHKKFRQRLQMIEQHLAKHDLDIQEICSALQHIFNPKIPTKRQIGFHAD